MEEMIKILIPGLRDGRLPQEARLPRPGVVFATPAAKLLADAAILSDEGLSDQRGHAAHTSMGIVDVGRRAIRRVARAAAHRLAVLRREVGYAGIRRQTVELPRLQFGRRSLDEMRRRDDVVIQPQEQFGARERRAEIERARPLELPLVARKDVFVCEAPRRFLRVCALA